MYVVLKTIGYLSSNKFAAFGFCVNRLELNFAAGFHAFQKKKKKIGVMQYCFVFYEHLARVQTRSETIYEPIPVGFGEEMFLGPPIKPQYGEPNRESTPPSTMLSVISIIYSPPGEQAQPKLGRRGEKINSVEFLISGRIDDYYTEVICFRRTMIAAGHIVWII